MLHRQRPVRHRIDAPLHDHVFGVGKGVDLGAKPEEQRVGVARLTLEQAGEAVRVEMAADALVSHQAGIQLRHAPQQAIAGGDAEHIVDQLKIFNVRADDVVFLFRVQQEQLLDLLIKKFLAVETGQPVVLHLTDHGGGLPQADDVGDPVQDDLRPVRFDHKIRRAAGESRYLGGFAVLTGGNDHGDGGERLLRLCLGQKRAPVHPGQDQIQQNQRDLIRTLPQYAKRLGAVFRLEHPILRRENGTEVGAVDRIVVYDQDLFLQRHDGASLSSAGIPNFVVSPSDSIIQAEAVQYFGTFMVRARSLPRWLCAKSGNGGPRRSAQKSPHSRRAGRRS